MVRRHCARVILCGVVFFCCFVSDQPTHTHMHTCKVKIPPHVELFSIHCTDRELLNLHLISVGRDDGVVLLQGFSTLCVCVCVCVCDYFYP